MTGDPPLVVPDDVEYAASTLENAAAILKHRARRRSILLAAFCNVMRNEARKIRAEAGR